MPADRTRKKRRPEIVRRSVTAGRRLYVQRKGQVRGRRSAAARPSVRNVTLQGTARTSTYGAFVLWPNNRESPVRPTAYTEPRPWGPPTIFSTWNGICLRSTIKPSEPCPRSHRMSSWSYSRIARSMEAGAYSVFTAPWPRTALGRPYLFVHEFGHHFTGLADEYYTAPVAYLTEAVRVEPWEANVTALLDTNNFKWNKLVSKDTPIPTPWK